MTVCSVQFFFHTICHVVLSAPLVSCFFSFRIKARLNNFRVPVDSSVRLIFARRVPRDEEHEQEEPLSPMSTTDCDRNPAFDRAKEEEMQPQHEQQQKQQHEQQQESAARASSVESKGPESSKEEDINDIDTDDGIDTSSVSETNEEHKDEPSINNLLATPLDKRQAEDTKNDEDKDGDMEEEVSENRGETAASKESFIQHQESAGEKDNEQQELEVQKQEQKRDGMVQSQEDGESASQEEQVEEEQVEEEREEEEEEEGSEMDDDRTEYERQSPVQMAEHRDVVFQSALDDSLR